MSKKERTRNALVVAALELFEQRGYEATSVAEIANRAGVTEMTFFRHFASKAAVLVDDPYDPLIAAGIRRLPAGGTLLATAAEGIAAAWGAVPIPEAQAVRDRLRVVSRTPSLRGALARSSASTEHAIRDALVDRGADRAAAHIAAAATVAALNASLLAWADGDDPDLGSAIDAALRILGAPA